MRGIAIPLQSIDYLEYRDRRSELTIGYREGETARTCFLDLQPIAVRDQIIASLVEAAGTPTIQGDRELGFWSATWPPLVALGAVMLAAIGIAAMARPGELSNDPLLKSLLAGAAVLAFLSLVWLIKRAMFPPRIQVLRLDRGSRAIV